MRFARLLIVGLLCLSGVAMGGEADGPYMLIYKASIHEYGGAVFTSTAMTQVCWNGGIVCADQKVIQVEYFPTIEKALQFINHRECPTCMRQDPDMLAGDIVGLFKARRIELELASTGRKREIEREIRQREVVPEQEWDVKPAEKPHVWTFDSPNALIRTIREQ